MFSHYFKIAFRNHAKHKIQSIISLLSLAIAFACVSLAIYWIHYEQTFDSFLANYDNIYKIANRRAGETYPDDTSCLPLPTYLLENYPEVSNACGIQPIDNHNNLTIEINNHFFPSQYTMITPEAVDMFDIQWLEGNKDIDSWEESDMAVSEQIARDVCGKESPIGLKLSLKKKDEQETISEHQIVAVFKTRPSHSNLNTHILKRLVRPNSPWQVSHCETYVQLNPNADAERFLQKLTSDTIEVSKNYYNTYNVLTPLKEVHYTYPEKKRNIQLNDVKLFTSAAILLSVCVLLNYLMLFVSRLRNRGRDMALRTICGSSFWQTGALLMVEYLVLLLGALILSIISIELTYTDFIKLAQLEINRSTVYAECSSLLLFILVLSTVLSLVPILYFKRKTLRVQMESTSIHMSERRFRVAGVCVQLFISLLFIFCASVMIKQVHYLIHDDIQIERKNIASLRTSINMKANQIMDVLRQIPSITEIVPVNKPLFPGNEAGTTDLHGFEDMNGKVIKARLFELDPEIAQFYGLRMKEGNGNFELANFQEYFINETLAKQLGYTNPVGKTFRNGQAVIKGIVYDFAYQPPTEPVRPIIFRKNPSKDPNVVAFKYVGDFATCKSAIEKAFKKELRSLKDGETVYRGYLSSELNLLKLLNIITIISLLIALVGVYALILQECERQRKNIAIRKVYGAQIKDILMMFIKEYMIQIVIAAALAFPIGYVLMKHWLEGYSRQISIGIELYLGIFMCMTILVILCIGWHVWNAANENPATAVKKE